MENKTEFDETKEQLNDEKINETKTSPESNACEPQKEKKKEKKKKTFDKEKEELKNANLELKEKVLRITAEMQNMKRRSEQELANAYKYDGFDLIEKLLPVIDNFDRALNTKIEGADKFLSGFKMIYDNLIEILKNKGVTEIEALNKPFDPAIMNGVMTEVNNEVEDGTVLEVLQKGYMYSDKLIRPAYVKVSSKE